MTPNEVGVLQVLVETFAHVKPIMAWFVPTFIGGYLAALLPIILGRKERIKQEEKQKERGSRLALATIKTLETDLEECLNDRARAQSHEDFKNIEVKIRAAISVAENSKQAIYTYLETDFQRHFARTMTVAYRFSGILEHLLDKKFPGGTGFEKVLVKERIEQIYVQYRDITASAPYSLKEDPR